eukprot:gene20090-47887_t
MAAAPPLPLCALCALAAVPAAAAHVLRNAAVRCELDGSGLRSVEEVGGPRRALTKMDVTKWVWTYAGGDRVRKDMSRKNIEVEMLPSFFKDEQNRDGWLSKANTARWIKECLEKNQALEKVIVLDSMQQEETELILTYDKFMYATPEKALEKIMHDKDLIDKKAYVRDMESGHGKWAQKAIPISMIDIRDVNREKKLTYDGDTPWMKQGTGVSLVPMDVVKNRKMMHFK